MWQQDVQEAKKRITLLVENKKHEYALVLGQFLMELVSKIRGSGGYVHADVNQDMVQLLAIIRGYCCQFDNHQQSTYALEGTKHRVLTFYQSYDETTTEYVEHFKMLVGVVETYGSTYGNELGLIKTQLIGLSFILCGAPLYQAHPKKNILSVVQYSMLQLVCNFSKKTYSTDTIVRY
jgi:hypothetical protein